MIRLYVLFDTVAGSCSPVISAVNDGMAIRTYKQLTREMGAAESETKLYYIGTIDKESMELDVAPEPTEVKI